jgi:hypothetical protein
MLSAGDRQYVFTAVNPQRHPKLAARAATTQSRTLAVNHLRATLCEAYIKNIYEDATQYIFEIVKLAARNGLDPNRFIGEHKVSFEANEILLAGSWNNVLEMVAESVYRRLENERSTKALFQKTSQKLNLGVAQATIEVALPYFEVRHLLVHADGRFDRNFCLCFPGFGAIAGQKIKLDYNFLQNAKVAIFNLINEFDRQIVANNVVPAGELQP